MNSGVSRRSKTSRGRWKTAGLTTGAIALTIATALGTAQPAAADEWSGNPPQWVGGRIFQEWDELGKPWAATGPERPAARQGRLQDFGDNSIYWHDLVSNSHANQIGGAIRTKYGERNWENGNLMYPTTRELPATGGRFNRFEGGSIYWSQSTGAHQIGGLIRDKWGSLDWERSPLGFPTTDEFVAGGGSGAGNHFQGGSIYYSQAGGTHPVWGDIKNQWAANGWENGKFGFPTSDEYDDLGGKVQQFQNGVITYGTKHITVQEHLWGWELKFDKYITDKITNGWLNGALGTTMLIAVALGLSEANPIPAFVAAIAGVAIAGVSLCKTPDEGATFYMTRPFGGLPSTVSCNPFAGRNAGGGDEGFEVTDFSKAAWPEDGTWEVPTAEGSEPSSTSTPTETSLPPVTSSAPASGSQAPSTSSSAVSPPTTTTASPAPSGTTEPTTSGTASVTTTIRPTTTTSAPK